MEGTARSTIWSVVVTFEAFTEQAAADYRQRLKELVAEQLSAVAVVGELEALTREEDSGSAPALDATPTQSGAPPEGNEGDAGADD